MYWILLYPFLYLFFNPLLYRLLYESAPRFNLINYTT